MLAMAERRDLGGASFSFRVREGGETWRGRNRTLINLDLFDVGPVISFPAYPQTSVSARSSGERRLPLALAKRFVETIR
jgi:phage head maturation protease